MRRLICLSPILIGNHQYISGDELPSDDPEYIQAWIRNGAAKWKEENPTRRKTDRTSLKKEKLTKPKEEIKE